MTDVAVLRPASLVTRIAQTYGVEPDKMLATMKATCFRSDKPITNEQMMALLIVAEQYHLNPFTKELFAFDDKRGGVIPYVSVDGWSRIVNEHPQFDGWDFAWNNHAQDPSITCTIYRKDRSHPTVVTEYLNECKRATNPWQTTPRRMLRHKALMQCARLAFGFAGIYDEDEAARIRDGGLGDNVPRVSTQRSALKSVLAASAEHFFEQPQVVDNVNDAPDGTLADLTAAMLASAEDAEACTEILDRGRSLLGDDEFSELAATYASIFNEEQR